MPNSVNEARRWFHRAPKEWYETLPPEYQALISIVALLAIAGLSFYLLFYYLPGKIAVSAEKLGTKAGNIVSKLLPHVPQIVLVLSQLVLVLGAIILVIFIFSRSWHRFWGEAAVKGGAIVGATLLVAFALRGLAQQKKTSTKKDKDNNT